MKPYKFFASFILMLSILVASSCINTIQAQSSSSEDCRVPCDAPADSHRVNGLLSFSPINPEYGSAPRMTLKVKTGWLYKFHVEAGNVYMWNTGPNANEYINGIRIRTKVTIFYDDNGSFSTPITSSMNNCGYNGYAEALAWRANYTGTVGVMVTCGTSNDNICETMKDSLTVICYLQEEYSSSSFLVRGRGGATDSVQCDGTSYEIFDSGSGNHTGCENSYYANNEDGYLTLYPGDELSRLKVWGSSNLSVGDTLFFYQGVYNPNDAMVPTKAITDNATWTDTNYLFLAANAGDPISLRMKSDSACTSEGFWLFVQCCANESLPSNLRLQMASDSCAVLSWDPAQSSSQITYQWELFDTLSNAIIASGSTQNYRDTVCGLDANMNYYFNIKVASSCSYEETQDVVVSDTNKYVYGLGVRNSIVPGENSLSNNVFESGAINGTTTIMDSIDSNGYRHATLRVCEGNAAQICFTMPGNYLNGENINVESTLRWVTNMRPRSFGNSNDSYYQEGDHYVIIMHTNSTQGCWITEELHENGYANVTATTESGSFAQAFVNVIIDTLPDINITIDNIITNNFVTCKYDSLDMTAHGGYQTVGHPGYYWTDSLNTDLFGAQRWAQHIVVPQLSHSNTYTVIGRNERNCIGFDTLRVKVNPLPTPIYQSNYDVCTRDTATIHIEGLAEYTFQRVDTTFHDTVMVWNEMSSKENLSVKLRGAGMPYDSVFTVIYAVPRTSRNDTLVIAADAIDTFAFDSLPSGPLYRISYKKIITEVFTSKCTIATNTDGIIQLSPNVGTDYYFFGTDTNGCAGAGYFHLNVIPRPLVSGHISDNNLCPGDTSLISITNLNDEQLYYRWWKDDVDSVYISYNNSIHVRPGQSCTYHVRVFNSHHCDTILDFPVYVYDSLHITLTAEPQSICRNDASILTAACSGVVSWQWTDDSIPSDTRTVSPQVSTNYLVTGTDSHGCTASNSVFVEVKDRPTPEYIPNDTICTNGTVDVITSGLADHYYWYVDNQCFDSTSTQRTIQPERTSTYQLIYSLNNGCQDTTYFNIAVFAFPTPSISSDTTICRGDSVTLTAGGGTHFAWNDEAHSTTSSITVSPADTTTYSVYVYTFGTCGDTVSSTVNIIPYFELSITHSADTICQFDTVRLYAHGSNNYIWDTGEEDISIMHHLDSTHIFSVRSTNEYTSCSRTVYDTIVVDIRPQVQIIPSDTAVCYEYDLQLTAEGNAAYYVWNTGDTNNLINLNPASSANYDVTAYTVFGCTSRDTARVTVNPLPNEFSINAEDSICYGDSTLILANYSPAIAIVQYHWNTSQANSTSNNFYYHPQNFITEPYQDVITVSVEDGNGCQRSASHTIKINPIPQDNIVSPNSICVYDTIHLSLRMPYQQYNWTGNPVVPQPSNEASVWARFMSPHDSANFSVTVWNEYGCTATFGKTVTVYDLPDITITSLSSSNYFCEGQSYTFTAQGASTYVWDNGATGSSITLVPTGASISVTGTDSHGCWNTSTYLTQIVHTPDIELSVTDTLVCAYQTVSITAQSPSYNDVQFIWNNAYHNATFTVESVTENSNPVVECYRQQGGAHCSIYDTAHIRLRNLPSLHVIRNDGPTCVNEPGLVVVSGATDFQWDSQPYLTVISHDTALVRPWIGGNDSLLTFTVRGLDDIGCQSILPISYYVYPKPQVVLSTSSNDNSICANNPIVLSASGAYSYRWYNENQFDQVISYNADWTLVSDTNRAFHVIGYTQHNCMDTNHINVIVHPNPTIEANAMDDEICYGFSTTLQGLCTIDNVSFTWTNLSTNESHTGHDWLVDPDTTTSYDLLVTDLATNCFSHETKRVVVNYSPVVHAFVPHGVCHGDSITIQGQDAFTYSWYYPSLDSLIGEGTNITLQPMDLPITTYQMVGTDIHGCRDTIDVPIHVNALPVLSSHNSEPGYLCVGGDGMLGASVSGDIPYLQYFWSASPEDNNSLFLNDVAFLSPDTSTIYTITGSYTDYGVTCSSSIQDTLIVYPGPDIHIISEIDTICAGHSITLEGTGAEQYIWYCDGVVGAGRTLEISPVRNTSYILIGQDTNRCYARDTIDINIAPNTPSAQVISDITPKCSLTPVEVVFSDSSYNYYWYPHTYLSDISGNSALVTPEQNISYKVLYTNIYGCWDSLTVPITVLPLPPLQLTPDTAVCEGYSITLRASGGSNYLWNDSLTTNYRTVTPTCDTSFSITAYNRFNCEKSDSVHITFIPKFDLEILSSRDSFCLEENMTILTARGAGDIYHWSNGDSTSSIIVYPETTTDYVLTSYNSGTNCFSSDTITVTRYPDMPLQINVSDTSICLDDSVTFDVAPANYPWYQWNDGFMLASRTTTPEQTATYYIDAINNYGCLMRDSITVTVHDHPKVEIAATGRDTCFGNSIQLSITGNAVRYEWDNGSTATSLSISQVSDADYILTGYSEYGCITKDTAHVVIHATPHDTIWSSAYDICQNDTIQLIAAGQYNYQWTPQQSVLNPQGNPAFAMPMNNTTYKAVYTDEYGCKDSATVHVDVRPSPVLDLTPSDTICAGDSVFIHVSGAYTYIWNTGSTASSFWVYPTHAETYTVRATNGFDCTTTGVVRLDYTPYFDLHLYSDKDTICIGDQVTLAYTGAADNYYWSTGSSQSHITVSPRETSVYWLTATNNASRCSQTLYDTITVWENPTITAYPDTIVCSEDTVCVIARSEHPFTYTWSSIPNCTFVGDPTGEQLCAVPENRTSFIYHAENQWCSISDSIVINISPNPIIQYEVEPDRCEQCIGSIDIDAYSPAQPVSLQWEPNVSTGFVANNLCEGMYTVTATDARGCHDQEIIVVDNLPAPVVEVTDIIDQHFDDDGNISINVVSSTGTPSIHWYSDSELLNELVEYAGALSADVPAGPYWITVTDENCSTVMYVECPTNYMSLDIYIPNAFTPAYNFNPIWRPVIKDAAFREFDYELYIYDRYGGLVFTSTEYELGWDGKLANGQDAPAAMYVYLLKVNLRSDPTSSKETRTGSVLLIR